MDRLVIRLVIIVLAVLILISTASVVGKVNEGDFDTIPPLKNENYRVLNCELIPMENVTTFCVADSGIALFYDGLGLINVYSLEGTFLYGLQVRTIQNGVGDIAFKDDYLYIRTRGNSVYIFCGKKLVRSFLSSEDRASFEDVEKIIEHNKTQYINGYTYSYLPNTNKVMKHTSNGVMISVIILPEIDTEIRIEAMMLLLLIAALAHFIRATCIISTESK